MLHRLRLIERLVLLLPCRVGGRIEKARVHGELSELHVFRSPFLYRRTFDLLYFTADFPLIFSLADRAANSYNILILQDTSLVLLISYFTYSIRLIVSLLRPTRN